jgi:RNA polymerase sigma-70 factor, ECF subfamily
MNAIRIGWVSSRIAAALRFSGNFLASPRPLREEAGTRLPATDDEAALLEQMQTGDVRAFDVLYARHQPPVFRYALRMSGHQSVAEDVVQEIFLSLILGARGYDAAAGPLRSYLYGMARHALAKRYRDGHRAESVDEDTAAPEVDPLAGLSREECVRNVRAALAALPAHYREAIVLCEMEELSYAEAAEILGVPVGTVRSRLSRAKALLFERLSRQGVTA